MTKRFSQELGQVACLDPINSLEEKKFMINKIEKKQNLESHFGG